MPENEVTSEETVQRAVVIPRPSSGPVAALYFLLALAICYTLYFARAILLPVTAAVILDFLLSPLVRKLSRLHIPHPVSAGLVIIGFLGLILAAGAIFYAPALDWFEDLPDILRNSESRMRGVLKPLEKVEKASEEIEGVLEGRNKDTDEDLELAASHSQADSVDPPVANDPGPYRADASSESDLQSNANSSDEDEVVRVRLQQPSLTSLALSTTTSAVAGSMVAIVLLYFLLASDEVVLRAAVRSVETLTAKKGIVETARTIEQAISKFLIAFALINLGLALVIGITMWFYGLPNPFLWGAMAGFLNFIPFVGFLIGSGIVALISLDTFADQSLWYCFLPPITYIIVNTIEGNFITPAVLGRSFRQSPVAIMMSILFWGWIWGAVGVLLAVPLLVIGAISLTQLEALQRHNDLDD